MESQAINLQDSSWIPPTYDIPRRDYFLDFMLIVVFPLVLALVLFIVLSIAMFGRRQGLDKRNQTTPEPQLVQFDTIRRATTNLRYMSNRRDGPAPVSPRLTASTPNFPGMEPLPGSSSGTSGRNSLPPPPYRLPPQYSPERPYGSQQMYSPDQPYTSQQMYSTASLPHPRRGSSHAGSVHDTATLPVRS